jgi:hypothetical protein
VLDADCNFVIDLEGAVVEVRGSDRAPSAVYRHHFLVQERLLILEDAHAASKELREITVCRVLYQRHVGSCSGRHHHARIDAPRNRFAERAYRFRLGQEVGVLYPDTLACCADRQVVENLYGWRGALRLDPSNMHGGVSLHFQFRKDVIPNEHLSSHLEPVFGKGRLH